MGAFNLIGAIMLVEKCRRIEQTAPADVSCGFMSQGIALKILEAPINCIQHDKGMKWPVYQVAWSGVATEYITVRFRVV